jgi:hypothetical protein
VADQPGKKGFSLSKAFAIAAIGLIGVVSPSVLSHNAESSPPQDKKDTAQTQPAPKPVKPIDWKKRLTGKDIIPGGPLGVAPQLPVPPNETAAQSPDDIWQNILNGDNTPYRPYMAESLPAHLPSGTGAVSLQIESSYSEVQGLLLSPVYDPTDALERHGGAATGILASTAARYGQRDANILFLERRDSLEDWFLNQNNPETRALLDHALVLSLSMAFIAEGNPANQTVGSLTTGADIERACALWQNSHTLLVWSAGNNGRDTRVDLERPAAFHTMCGDAVVRVGEAERDRSTGFDYIEVWSSRPASFVMKEPFQEGYKYQYFRDAADARQYISALFNARAAGSDRTNAELFEDKVARGYFNPKRLRDCHPSFNGASFEGKDILKKDKAWMMQHPAEVREAFTSCLADATEKLKSDSGADRNGMVGGKRGTSFSGPTFAGLAAAAHEKHPELTDYDLVAAALMAAKPLERVARADGSYGVITYHDNGRGLRHNAYAGGFGLLEPDDYMRVVDRMAGMLAADPSLTTREIWLRSPEISFSRPSAQTRSYKDYRIPVIGDAGVLQTILKLRFAGGNGGVPAKIKLINPMGVEEELSPTKTGGHMEYSMANTLGNFGNHSRGVWTVRVPANVTIEQAQLIIPGFAAGGVIDRMLDQVTGHAAPVADPPQFAPPRPLTLQPAAR